MTAPNRVPATVRTGIQPSQRSSRKPTPMKRMIPPAKVSPRETYLYPSPNSREDPDGSFIGREISRL